VEEFSYTVTAEGFVYGKGWGEGACYAGYMRSDVAVKGTGFNLWLVAFGGCGSVPWTMACFRHSRAQSTRARPASSTLPTKYVSLRSAWSPP